MIRAIIIVIAFIAGQWAEAQTVSQLKKGLPKEKGWALSDSVETFDRDNLFERINGAAPGYLLYNFEELDVFVYNKVGSADYITVQIYRHATPADAFGIYASERPQDSRFLPIGAESYQEGAILNMVCGCLYVKIDSPSEDAATVATISAIARDFAKNMRLVGKLPSQLRALPVNNRIAHSEQYIATSFLGHTFLNKAFTADYQADGKTYQVFLLEAESVDAARAMLERYFSFAKKDGVPQENVFTTIDDRYNGTVACIWHGRYIRGLLNDNDAPIDAGEILKNWGVMDIF